MRRWTAGALALLLGAGCKPVIQSPGAYPARDVCQLEREATDIVLADVLSWGEPQTRRLAGRRYQVTPVKLRVRTAFKGGHFGEQTAWFLGAVAADGKSAYGPLRPEGQPATAIAFLADVDPDLVLVGGGYLWRAAPGVLKNTAKFAEGLQEIVLRRELEAAFRASLTCERAAGPGLLGH